MAPRKLLHSVLRPRYILDSLPGEITAVGILSTSKNCERLNQCGKLRSLYNNMEVYMATVPNQPGLQSFAILCEVKLFRKYPTFSFVPILAYNSLTPLE